MIPSPEIKSILKEFVRINREKYGEDWKNILAKEISSKSVPFIDALLKAQNIEKTSK